MRSARPTSCDRSSSGSRAPADLYVIEGGDHSYKVPKKLMPQQQVYEFVLDEVDRWLRRRV